MAYYQGTTYITPLLKQRERTTEELQKTLDEWYEKTFWQKVDAALELNEVYGLRNKVIRDILASRRYPNGKAAKKIARELAAWRKREARHAAWLAKNRM